MTEAAVAYETPAMRELAEKRASMARTDLTDEELELSLPHPVGYRILIALPDVEETYSSGLIKAGSTINAEYILSIIGLVVELGNGAYTDKERFSEPWCKVGDYVMFRANSGTRFKVNGREYRLMNDDSIEAVVPNPRIVSKA